MDGFFKQPKSLQIDENIHSNWKKFLQAYKIFLTASGKGEATPEVRAAILLNCIGEDALELINTFELSDNDLKDPDKIIQAFENYIKPRQNIIYERYVFYNRNQQEGEDFEHFLTAISKLVKTCDFGTQQDDMLRDRIVLGIRNREVQERMLRNSQLVLREAIKMCRAAEISKQQVKGLHEATVDSVKQKFNKKIIRK